MVHIVDGSVIALIPARSGSSAIKNKNIAAVGGYPLIAYSIAAAKLCSRIGRIIVSTDSMHYAELAKKYGAEIPFLRPENISQKDSLDIEYISHALNTLMDTEGCIPEFIMLLRPTTPLRDPQKLDEMFELLSSKPDATSIVSVSETEECPYKWMLMNESGYLASPFSELKPDDVNLPRQSFPKVFVPDGYADIIKSSVVLEQGCAYGDRAVPWFSPENVIDIDSQAELSAFKETGYRESRVHQYLLDTYKRNN